MHAENTHASLFDLFRRGQCAHNCGRRVDATRMLLVHAFGEHLPATEYLTDNHTAWFRSNTPKPFLTRTQGQKSRSLWVSNTDKWLRQSWQKFFEAEIPLRHCEAYTFAVPRDHRLVFGILVGVFDITGVAGGITPAMDVAVRITRADGSTEDITTKCRIDTLDEVEYYRHGGILQYVLRNIAAEAA